MKFDIIIIGGGAAGLFCAAQAGKRGKRTVVIEHNSEPGRKIVISGGGRCNFTNTGTTHENFISQNPHFAKSALSRFTPADFIKLVKKHRIEFYEKKLGQLFCRERSSQIVEMLLKECRNAKASVETNCTVKSVSKDGELFSVETSRGIFAAEKLVVAAGGLSFPKIGATDIGYRIARQFGLKIVETRPSLVPLIFAEKLTGQNIAGVSILTEATAEKSRFRENILFTHRGMSGPAILQASNYWQPHRPIIFDLLPETNIQTEIETNRNSKQKAGNFLKRYLPERFIDAIAAGIIADKPVNELSNKDIEIIVEFVHSWQVKFSTTEGWHKAEVTIGGVSTAELSSQTMESKKVPGLYFIGEVVDVTGWLGGYNFQWAWASAFAAGNSI